MSGKSNPYLQHLEGNGVGGGGGGSKEGRSGGLNPYNLRPFSDRYYEILEVRKRLPVYDHREELVKLVGENPIIVLVGETGSGKTTQTPQFLVDAGYAPVLLPIPPTPHHHPRPFQQELKAQQNKACDRISLIFVVATSSVHLSASSWLSVCISTAPVDLFNVIYLLNTAYFSCTYAVIVRTV